MLGAAWFMQNIPQFQLLRQLPQAGVWQGPLGQQIMAPQGEQPQRPGLGGLSWLQGSPFKDALRSWFLSRPQVQGQSDFIRQLMMLSRLGIR